MRIAFRLISLEIIFLVGQNAVDDKLVECLWMRNKRLRLR